jgi:PleD family two-component response regulator
MDAEGIVSRLLENIKRFNDTQQRNYVLSMSVGVAKYSPDEPCTIDELISKADRMMYERKKGK